MKDDLHHQARAIREQHERLPEPRKETPREARWRSERERNAAELKKHPHKGY
ncbi:hypothetical protein [Burkholderia pseudomallei]|uniref:hypothetical protein n=1 Tax=Burkholderia pseudomallei TaxID=28450 RepID=UPI0015C3A433|nr:hypothetical protein [Burkholderia pseudomallei]MBF3825435.1 hypothetical protein [Burkholderia pseudomallei]